VEAYRRGYYALSVRVAGTLMNSLKASGAHRATLKRLQQNAEPARKKLRQLLASPSTTLADLQIRATDKMYDDDTVDVWLVTERSDVDASLIKSMYFDLNQELWPPTQIRGDDGDDVMLIRK
jgi:hypothetical protein